MSSTFSEEQWLALRELLPGAMDVEVSEGFAARTAEGIYKQVHVPRPKREVWRGLWGGLAWGLTAATCAGLEASQTLARFVSHGVRIPMTIATEAEVRRLAMTSPDWLCDWKTGSVLMFLLGVWMLRPWRFWRRLRGPEEIPVGTVLWFGVGLLLLGLGTSLPAMTWLWSDPDRELAGGLVASLATWALLAMACTSALIVLRCARSTVAAAWLFAACMGVCLLVEPSISPALVSQGVPALGDRERSYGEALAEQQDLTQHGAPVVLGEAYGTRLSVFANNVPMRLICRLYAAEQVDAPAAWWTVPVVFAGGLALMAGLLLAGGPWRVEWLLVAAVAAPWIGWAGRALAPLTRPSLAYQAVQSPHPELARTVVSLTHEVNGQLTTYGYPLPGLVDAMLQSPGVDAIERCRLLRTRAGLMWDRTAWMDAEVRRASLEQGLDWDLCWGANQFQRIDWDHSHETGPPGPFVSASELRGIQADDRPQVARLLGDRRIGQLNGTIVMAPEVDVQGVVWLNGKPAADVPVRLYRAPENSTTDSTDYCYCEVQGAIRQCFEDWPGLDMLPEVSRTDANGHFRVHNVPTGVYCPAIMLAGRWNHASTHDAARASSFKVADHDVDLGRFNVEVSP